MILSLAVSLLVAILVAAFAFQNSEPVVVRFFRIQFHVSLGLALTVSAAAGVVVGLLASAALMIRKGFRIAAMRRREGDGRPPPRG